MPAPLRTTEAQGDAPAGATLAQECEWTAPLNATLDLAVQASRIKWDYSPSFDPRPYLLNPRVLAVLDDPEVQRLPRSEWPEGYPPARVHADRANLLSLLRKWDDCGALFLAPVKTLS